MNWILVGGKGSVAFFFFFFGTATAEGIIWNSPWLRPRWKHGIFISIPFFRLTLAGLLALQTQLRYPLFQNNRLIRTRCVWVRGSIYACWDKKWTRQRERDLLRLLTINRDINLFESSSRRKRIEQVRSLFLFNVIVFSTSASKI